MTFKTPEDFERIFREVEARFRHDPEEDVQGTLLGEALDAHLIATVMYLNMRLRAEEARGGASRSSLSGWVTQLEITRAFTGERLDSILACPGCREVGEGECAQHGKPGDLGNWLVQLQRTFEDDRIVWCVVCDQLEPHEGGRRCRRCNNLRVDGGPPSGEPLAPEEEP